MSNYLARVRFADGHVMYAMYNNTSDYASRELIDATSEQVDWIEEVDQSFRTHEQERFDELHAKQKLEAATVAASDNSVSPDVETVQIDVPGYGASWQSVASRAAKLIVCALSENGSPE